MQTQVESLPPFFNSLPLAALSLILQTTLICSRNQVPLVHPSLSHLFPGGYLRCGYLVPGKTVCPRADFCSAEYRYENMMVPDTISRETRKQKTSGTLVYYVLISRVRKVLPEL